MILSYDFYKSIWLINNSLTKEVFLEIVGAKDGYAKNMFSRIYDSVFSERIDMEREYNKYYSFEYESFEKYLYKKYNLEPDDIERLIEEKKKYPHCNIYRKDDHSYGDYQIPQLVTSEVMRDRINNILKMMYEN